jgi:hypothetical protein
MPHAPGSLSCPLGNRRIGSGKIGHADLPIEQRMAKRLVFVQDQTLGFCALFRLQAGTRPGDDVFAIERATPVAELDQTESSFHNSLQYGRERFRAEKD